MADHTGMADHKEPTENRAPDYELDATLQFSEPEHYRALFEETRLRIVDLLLERAATTSELAEALGKPKGTVGHHVGVLEDAGLIRIVRTKKVRAIEAKYYGRTARTYLLGDKDDPGIDVARAHFLTTAASEYGQTVDEESGLPGSTLRYARIPTERATEWAQRLFDLAEEFTASPRGGQTTYGLLVAMYPTDRPHLPDKETE